MRLFRRLSSVLLCGVLSCFGLMAYANDVSPRYLPSLVLFSVSDHGHALAKFEAEHAFMTSLARVQGVSIGAGLRRDSHGYLQCKADDYEGFSANGLASPLTA